jgi:hypothetical protein
MKTLSDKRLLEILNTAQEQYEGDCTVLESAMGALVWGRIVGWHGLRVIHSSRTFKRYEEILGIEFREVLPEQTEQSERLNGIRLAKKFKKFWQAISSGEISGRDAAKTTLA